MIRNLKTDLKSEFGCPNTAEERESCAGGVPWPPRVEAVCHTAQHALWSRVAHTPTRGQGWFGLCLLDKNAPLLLPLNAFSSLNFQQFEEHQIGNSAEMFMSFVDLL